MAQSIDISIVIPSYNSEKTIRKCIDSVLKQKTNLKYEVIVADSSQDNTPHIIKKYSPKVTLIHSNLRMFAGKARNVGIKKAKGNVIICLDSDCVLGKEDWIDTVYESMKSYDVVGVRICNGNPSNLFGWGIFLMEFCEWLSNKNKNINVLVTYCVLYNRKIFQKYGLFPESKFINEDMILHSRIKEQFFFCGKAFVRHINKTNFLTIVSHCFKLGRGAALTRKTFHNLPGSFLVKYPFLIPLLPFYRVLHTGYRSIGAGYALPFLITIPLIFVNAISYSFGFFVSALAKKR